MNMEKPSHFGHSKILKITLKILYIIHNQQLNITKIGITNNINRRVRQLECQSGCKLNIYYQTEYFKRAKLIENSLHQHFKMFRLEGEYFNIEPELAKEKLLFIIENLSKVHNPL